MVEMTELTYSSFWLHFAEEQECRDIGYEGRKWPLNVVHLQKFIVLSSPTIYYLDSSFLVPTFNLFITIRRRKARNLSQFTLSSSGFLFQ